MFKRVNLARFLAAHTVPAVLVLSLAGAAFATDKAPIHFAPGTNSASLKGEIQGMDRDVYPITAKAGQTMQVQVTNKRHLVLFRIQKPGTEEAYLPKAGAEDDATQWKGTLPASGTYKIIVGAMRGDDTRYTLDVRIAK